VRDGRGVGETQKSTILRQCCSVRGQEKMRARCRSGRAPLLRRRTPSQGPVPVQASSMTLFTREVSRESEDLLKLCWSERASHGLRVGGHDGKLHNDQMDGMITLASNTISEPFQFSQRSHLFHLPFPPPVTVVTPSHVSRTLSPSSRTHSPASDFHSATRYTLAYQVLLHIPY